MNRMYFSTCAGLQFRLLRKKLPALLAMALAALLLGGAGALAGRALLAGRNFSGATIAVATEEPDERLDFAVRIVSGMQEISSFATIVQTTPEQAEGMVTSGAASAAVILPPGFLDSVLQGRNDSPRVLLSTARPLETMLVMNIAESALRMLASAQQGIGFVQQAYLEAGATSPPLEDVMRDINVEYILWVVGHSGIFENRSVNVTGALPVGQHYLLAAVLFFAALALPLLYRLFSLPAQKDWLRRLRSAGCPLWLYTAAQLVAGFVGTVLLLCLLLAGAAAAGGGAFSPALVPAVLLAALFLCAFGYLCCNTGSLLAAVTLNFLLAAVGLVVAGGVVPLVLLPAPLAALAPLSPLGWMHGALAPLFAPGTPAGAALLPLGVGGAVLLACCFLVAVRTERRGA